jgi:hypothetical protein
MAIDNKDRGLKTLHEVAQAAGFNGQINTGIYFSNSEHGINITAVREAAGTVAQDEAVKCLVLEHRPKIKGREDQTRLRLDRIVPAQLGDGAFERTTYVFTGQDVYREGREGNNGSSATALAPIDIQDAIKITVALRGVRNAKPNRLLGR